MTTPAPLHRLVSVAWVIALAHSSNRIQAVAAMPWALPMVLQYAMRRTVYQSEDRDGVVFFGRHRPALDAILAIALILAFLTVLVTLDVLTEGRVMALGVPQLAALAFLGYGLAGFLRRGAGSVSAITGPETPPGDQYALMALSQRPGTWLSAIGLARRLVHELPDGSVVVAAAGDEELAKRYERLGFARGEGLRVYLITREQT